MTTSKWTGADRLSIVIDDQPWGFQAELARKIGLDSGEMSRIKTGDRGPKADVLVSLCRELNISADWLLGLTRGPRDLVSNSDHLYTQEEVLDILMEVVTEMREAVIEVVGPIDRRASLEEHVLSRREAGGSVRGE